MILLKILTCFSRRIKNKTFNISNNLKFILIYNNQYLIINNNIFYMIVHIQVFI